MTPAVRALCAGGVSCPMMQRATAEKPPCHQREAISGNHSCCMQSGEVATDSGSERGLRSMVVMERTSFPSGVESSGHSPRVVSVLVVPSSQSLFLLHSSFLT